MKNNCPFCNKINRKLQISLANCSLYVCSNCQLGYLSPMPSDAEINNLYSKKYFTNSLDLARGYTGYRKMANVLSKESQRKIKYIKKYTNNKKLLDVGCGLGIFLKIAAKASYDVSGNDISSYAKEKVTRDLKSPFYQGSIISGVLPSNFFNIVTVWDVVEHIPQVNKVFSALNNTITRGGYLFLTTPNIKSWDSKLLGKYWYGYKKIPEHLIFFSPYSITQVLGKNGFKVIEIKTWGFERDLKFMGTKLSLYLPTLGRFINIILKKLKLENRSIYLPLTDMMVVAQKA